MSDFGQHESNLWLPWGVLDEMPPDLAAYVKGIDTVETKGVETAHPVATERLRRYWTHGEGAAKIQWGVPGDFKRCVALVSKYMPGRAEGYCANRHKEATGGWPGHAPTEEAGHAASAAAHGKSLDGYDDNGVPYDENHPDVIFIADVEQAAYEEWAKTLDPNLAAECKALDMPGIFNVAGWVRNLVKDATSLLQRVYTDAGRREQANLRDQVLRMTSEGIEPPVSADDIDTDFDVSLPDVASAITSQVNRIADVEPATYARITDTLAEGESKGETMPQLSDRVQAVFETSKMRAMRIARTEVTAGANNAQMIAAQRNGATTKTWVAIHDPRTREAHAHVDGKTVAIDGAFLVGGVPMEFPGDPAAPPSLVVNCRCTLKYGFGVDYPGAPESREWLDGLTS